MDLIDWLDSTVMMVLAYYYGVEKTEEEVVQKCGRDSDSEVADGHYSVVVGLDEQNIYLQDPEIGKLRTIARDDFMRVWFDFTGEYISSWEEMIVRQLIVVCKE